MDPAAFLLMLLVGAALVGWGVRQMRQGFRKLDRTSAEADAISNELDVLQSDIKDTMSRLYREGEEDP